MSLRSEPALESAASETSGEGGKKKLKGRKDGRGQKKKVGDEGSFNRVGKEHRHRPQQTKPGEAGGTASGTKAKQKTLAIIPERGASRNTPWRELT